MSEYKTLKELLGDATESKGRKFIDEVGLVFEPKFLLNTKWYGVNQQHENVIAMSESMYRWEEWQPPKNKVTKYLWATKKGVICTGMAKDREEFSKKFLYDGDVSAYTRLDWSATEFDDD